MRKSERERRAIERLREWISPGDTIHCILRHVSRSGMLRVIDLVKCGEDGGHLALGWNAAIACGNRYDRDREGIRISGCGMDMGFALVYELSRTLWPEGFGCIGEGCPSNDHNNGDRDYTPHGLFDENGQPENREPGPGELVDGCRNHWHNSGGYALRHRWL